MASLEQLYKERYSPATDYADMCTCRVCDESRFGHAEKDWDKVCDKLQRLISHSKEVHRLLSKCPDTIILIVGKDRIIANKALLAFYSDFFNSLLYGEFVEAGSTEITLLELESQGLETFVNWTYTGIIESELPCDRLWILGDRLCAPTFQNEAMQGIFSSRLIERLWPETIDHIYKNTIPGSKLRKYFKDTILASPPFDPDDIAESIDEQKEYHMLLQAGGDLITDVCCEGSFYGSKEDTTWDQLPYYWANHSKYLEDVKSRQIEDFIQEKTRSGTRNTSEE